MMIIVSNIFLEYNLNLCLEAKTQKLQNSLVWIYLRLIPKRPTGIIDTMAYFSH